MNIKFIKDNISIVDFLSKLGYEPKRVRGSEHYYISMIRDSDTDPSLAVNESKGVWNDFGQAKGGNILDLAMELFKTKDVSEVIGKISSLYNKGDSFSFSKQPVKSKGPIVKHIVHAVKDLGNNDAISQYIASRGVWSAAQRVDFLKEVYYDHVNENGTKRRYFGVGWKNESGGYDVRSKYGKICLSKKDILFREQNSDQLNIFEGMFNFLTAVELNGDLLRENLIVLNSLSLINRAIGIINTHSRLKNINLFLDNGPGGRKATNFFQIQFPNSIDRADLYKGYDDFNDFHLEKLKKKTNPWDGNTNGNKIRVRR